MVMSVKVAEYRGLLGVLPRTLSFSTKGSWLGSGDGSHARPGTGAKSEFFSRLPGLLRLSFCSGPRNCPDYIFLYQLITL